MRVIFIENYKNYHYEIIESILCKYDKIIGIKKSDAFIKIQFFYYI